MSQEDYNLNLPPEEIAFLKELEEISAEALKEVHWLINTESYIDDFENEKMFNKYQRGYTANDGHIVGLSLRVFYQDNKMRGIHLGEPYANLPSSIVNLKYLEYLDLFGNHFSVNLPQSIYQLNKLEYLNLGGNSLTDLDPAIGTLENLRELYLNGNKITKFPDSICDLAKLEIIEIKNNRISELNTNFGNLQNLRKLDMESNNLSTLPASFFKLKNLKYLDLSENNFETISDSFKELKQLENLNFQVNLITEIPKSLSLISNLKYLNLLQNQIEEIPDFLHEFPNLNELFISGLKIKNIPDSIGNIKSLTVLELDLGDIEKIPESIGNLSNLIELLITKTHIKTLPKSIGNLKNLKSLHLFNNELKDLPSEIENLSNLKVLNLDQNQIKTIPIELGNLRNLIELSLSHNLLSNLPKTLANLKYLKKLSISNNKFKQLPTWIWRLKNLKDLYLFDNPWQGEWKEITKKALSEIIKYCLELEGLKIFISHAVSDYDVYRIKELSDFLEAQDIILQAYFCEEDLRGNIDEFMNLTVPKCNILIFIGTPQSTFNSIDCKHELELAYTHKLEIIPVKGEQVLWTDLESLGLDIDNGIEFSNEDFKNFCKKTLSVVEDIFEKMSHKEIAKISFQETLENIKKKFTAHFESSEFKQFFQDNMDNFKEIIEVYREQEDISQNVMIKFIKLLKNQGDEN